MKRFLLRLLAFALVAGLAVAALGPTALRQYGRWHDSRVAANYRAASDALTPLDCGTLLAEARAYNAALGGARWTDPFAQTPPENTDEAYRELLNPCGNGVMAVLELPKLGATLPVYHGARDAALGAGVGHLESSSLPVGDTGGMCVLVARRGGWLAGPFAGLDRLIPGDRFYIRTLQDTLVYEVAQAVTVAPDALAGQDTGDGADECVLMTTTPYGADTDRLLVRGRRVPMRSAQPSDDTRAVPAWLARLVFAAPVAAAGLVVLAVIEALRRGLRRRKRRRMKL